MVFNGWCFEPTENDILKFENKYGNAISIDTDSLEQGVIRGTFAKYPPQCVDGQGTVVTIVYVGGWKRQMFISAHGYSSTYMRHSASATTSYSDWYIMGDGCVANTANLALGLNGVLVGQSSDDYPSPWFRVADCKWPANYSYENFQITFLVQQTYAARYRCGILRIDLRTNSEGKVEYASLSWPMCSSDIKSLTDRFVLNYNDTLDERICALFVNIPEPWAAYDFTVLSFSSRERRNFLKWELYNTGLTHGGECDTLPYPTTATSVISM